VKDRFSTIVVVTVVTVLLVAACSPAATPPPEEPEEKVVKVGIMSPYTGTSAREGGEHKNSFIMAFDAVDWKIGDYKIEPVWIDTEGDPEKAVRAYEAAVLQDKIDVGVYGWYSSVAIPIMDVVAKHKIPHFFGGGSSAMIVEKYRSDEKYSYWLGKHWPNFDKLQIGYLEALEEAIEEGVLVPEDRKIIVGSDNSEGPMDQVRSVRRLFEDAGWEVVAEEHWPSGEMDFYPLLAKVASMDAKVLYVVSTPAASFTAFVKQAGESELEKIVIADGLGWCGEWYEATGDASDYVMDLEPVWSVSDAAMVFRDEFRERWDLEPGSCNAGLSQDYANFLVKVLQRTYEKYGELNRETIYKVGIEEVMTGKLTYADGMLMKEYKFAPETAPDPVVGGDYFMYPAIQYFSGEPVILWPSGAKEADLKLPPRMQE
jgi:branched-chain amino acid transport system substrate-binding protein